MDKRTGRDKGVAGITGPGEQVKREREPRILRLWLFSWSGLTAEAEEYARAQGILWSVQEDLNELLLELGLRELPTLDET